MKPSFLKYFIFPVFFLLVFQGEGRGEVFSGFGKEVGEETAACVKEHSNEALFLLIKNADNDAARIRYSHAWNYLDLAESSSKLDPTVLTKLGDDLLDANFATFLEGGVGRVKAWEAVVDHPVIRKDQMTLLSASKILDNSSIEEVIGKEELQIIVDKLALKGVKCRTCTGGNSSYRYMDQILDDIEHGAVKFGEEYSSVITGFKQGGNFTEGAMWVAEGVKKYPDDFPSNALFEFTEITEGGVRRVDVKVPNGLNGNKDIFFEFKSVQEVPPSGFATQFVKDMDLPDVTDLNQLRWWFDGNKVSSLPKQDFLDALENMNLNQNTIDKFFPGQTNVPFSQLIDEIDLSFGEIFSVK